MLRGGQDDDDYFMSDKKLSRLKVPRCTKMKFSDGGKTKGGGGGEGIGWVGGKYGEGKGKNTSPFLMLRSVWPPSMRRCQLSEPAQYPDLSSSNPL